MAVCIVAVPVGERFGVGLVEERADAVADLLDGVVPRLRPHAVLVAQWCEGRRRSLPVFEAHPLDDLFWQRRLDLNELAVGEHHDAASLVSVLRAVQVALLQAETDTPGGREREWWQQEEGEAESPRRCVQADVGFLGEDVGATGKKADTWGGQHRNGKGAA